MTLVLAGSLHRKCGGHYALATETVTLRVSGMPATVERGLFQCSECGDEHRTVEQRETAEAAAVAQVRARHSLMVPKEIKQLRERLALTHTQLGDLLYGVPRSVVEGWERGRYVQNPEADALLRSLNDRATLELRAAKSGVVLPVIEQPVLGMTDRDVPTGAVERSAEPAYRAAHEQEAAIPVVPAADLAPTADADVTRSSASPRTADVTAAA